MRIKVLSLILFFSPLSLSATVGSVVSGQSLWWIDKRIGQTYDSIETKVNALSAGCPSTALTSADVSATGTVMLSASGNYCLSEDLTTDVFIDSPGVALDLNDHCLTGVVQVGEDQLITLSSPRNVVVKNGIITPPAPTTTLPVAAVSVRRDASRVQLKNLLIKCTDTAGDTEAEGRSGMQIKSSDVRVMGCTVFAGAAGGNPVSGPGKQGGHGIELTSTAANTVVRDCEFTSGDGGDGAGGSDGGAAGIGIYVNGAQQAEIVHNIVMKTGDVGAGIGVVDNSGIFIDSTAVDVSVHDCIVRNVGQESLGALRIGINDDVTTGANLSTIFRNIVYDIDATSTSKIYFDLQASGLEDGINLATTTTLVPTATIQNYMVNVYMDEA